MINIVIPMAGAGSRFSKAGFKKPKPFIDVSGKPMIVRVLENLALPDARYILIANNQHMRADEALVSEIVKKYQATFIGIDGVTEGSACTVLNARAFVNNDDPLLIANSDQIVDFDVRDFYEDCFNKGLDGSLLVFKDEKRDPKWSFVRIDSSNKAVEVREKDPISELATVGIYLYRHGKDFVDAAIEMILQQDRVNNEYYTCPTYNYLIADNKNIGTYEIPFCAMHGVGTPEDLQEYNKFLE